MSLNCLFARRNNSNFDLLSSTRKLSFELFDSVREMQKIRSIGITDLRKEREKDKQIAEEEMGECPDCSLEDEIFQFFFFKNSLKWY